MTSKQRFFLGIALILIASIAPAICLVKKIQFNQDCSGYLKQAADASTVELALDRVDKALDYIEANNLKSGYTSVIYRTEDENVGFWYENIKQCKKELEESIGGSQLETSNVLMKVRETLTDEGESGTTLTIPEGIWKFPNNTMWAILNGLSFIFYVFVVFLWCSPTKRRKY